MNVKSRIGTLVLILSFIATGTLAWAGGQHQTGTAPRKTIHVSMMIGQFELYLQAQKQFMNTLIAKFEKQNPGVKISYQTYATSGEENASIQTSLATDQGPDVFDFGGTVLPTAYATNGFHVLSQADWQTLGGTGKFFKATLSMSGPSADKYIGVPEYMFPFVLAYNTKMFQEAGITSPPTTWTEFVNDAKKLTHPNQGVWGTIIDASDSYTPWKICWDYTKQLGSDFFSPDLKTAQLDSPQSIESLRFWFDWVTKYKIASPADLSYKQAEEVAAFANGKAAMLPLAQPSFLPSLEKSAIKGEFAIAPMPTIPYGMTSLPPGGEPVGTIVAGQYFAVPKYASGDVYQVALKWLGFMTAVPQQRLMYKTFGYLPVVKAAYTNYAPLDTPFNTAFAKAEANAYPTPYSGAFGYLEAAYGAASTKIADEIATSTYKPGDIARVLKAANQQVQANLEK